MARALQIVRHGEPEELVLAEVRAPGPGVDEITIFPPLAPLDVDDHSLTVDIADLQASQLGAPHPGSVERHEHDAMKRGPGGVDQASDLFLTENRGQAERLFRIRSFRHAPGLLERL